jgi:hypothetical protein
MRKLTICGTRIDPFESVIVAVARAAHVLAMGFEQGVQRRIDNRCSHQGLGFLLFSNGIVRRNTLALSIRESNPLVGMSMAESCAKLLLAFARPGKPQDRVTLVNGDPAASERRQLTCGKRLPSRTHLCVRDDVITL